MTEASPTSNPSTLSGTTKSTCSQESEDGALLADLLAGETTARSGPRRVRASRSQSREKVSAPVTHGICGLTYFASPVPSGPLSSWENRLRQRLGSIGSTECDLTWKASVTPAGASLSRLVRSTRRTDETGCGLWPTPQHREKGGGDYSDPAKAKAKARLDSGHQINLQDHAVAMWPTPTSLAPAKGGNNEAGNSAGLVAIREVALWSTIRASDGEKGGPNMSFGQGGTPLPAQAARAFWHTPTAKANQDCPSMAKWPGAVASGSSEPTEKPGALNPEFVFWLMGFPPEWLSCAPEATRSSRRSPLKS